MERKNFQSKHNTYGCALPFANIRFNQKNFFETQQLFWKYNFYHFSNYHPSPDTSKTTLSILFHQWNLTKPQTKAKVNLKQTKFHQAIIRLKNSSKNHKKLFPIHNVVSNVFNIISLFFLLEEKEKTFI